MSVVPVSNPMVKTEILYQQIQADGAIPAMTPVVITEFSGGFFQAKDALTADADLAHGAPAGIAEAAFVDGAVGAVMKRGLTYMAQGSETWEVGDGVYASRSGSGSTTVWSLTNVRPSSGTFCRTGTVMESNPDEDGEWLVLVEMSASGRDG